MTTSPASRPAIVGRDPSTHASTRAAVDLLLGPAANLDELREELGEGLSGGFEDVLVDRPSRLLFSTDASIYEMEPIAVVYPRSAEDIRHVVQVAARRGLPVLPRGAGTSLAGQTVNHAIVIDASRYMDGVLEVNEAERWARVQPGLVIAQLNRMLRPYGLQYPIDPATQNRATIGGGIGNNSCGSRSVVYGKTIDQVVSLEVVLADGSAARFDDLDGERLRARLELPGLEGDCYRAVRRLADEHRVEIDRRFPRIQRRVSGYNLDAFVDGEPMNLSKIVVGSEGTLAFVTEAKVRLVPIPAAKALAALHFGSVREATRAVLPILDHGPSTVELVGREILERCRESVGFRPLVEFVQGRPGALLLVELTGDDPAEARERLRRLSADMAQRGIGYACHEATDVGEQLRIWRMRQAGLGLLMSVKGDAKPIAFVEDTAVDPARLPDFVARFDEIVERHGTRAAYYGHASVGCLHIRPLVNIKQEAGLEATRAIAEEVADLVLEFGGALSGEHGDGILRGVFTERMFGAEIAGAFRELKHAFDPRGIFNPGKIVETPPFDDHLRLSPATRSLRPRTRLDFSADGGLAGAIELCNGQGACRKDEGGMCPSYMVTRDEEHSTRGRANLLRQAINGILPPDEVTGDAIHEALDLCVECKACKSECPSGVDMAKLKFEILSRRHEARGMPLRDRAFSRIATLAAAGSRFAPLVNRVGSAGLVRELLHRALGVHRARPLPALAGETFRHWYAHRTPTTAGERGEVVLFDDTFANYFHPEVARAAVGVIEGLGYRVRLIRDRACCGRPYLSKGDLAGARELARRNIDALRAYGERGLPIVGIEPSCLLTLRDEYPDLLPGQAADTVAGRALLLDEWLVQAIDADPGLRRRFGPTDRSSALLHAHCHQKALAGTDPSLAALALVPGLRAELIDSPCCGMAGSFGFEAEHYEISRAMGALRLFPAVEDAGDATEILVTGTSCRQQIDHFTRRRPRHVVEILAESIRHGGAG